MRNMSIGGVDINDNTPCFIIAEIGHNHGGNIEFCKEMFVSAKESGADAVKLQKRDNKDLFTKDFYNEPYLGPNSFGATYGAHRERLEFDINTFRELSTFAKSIDLLMFATAFDIKSADELAYLDMPAIKIASADISNIPLLRHVSKLNIPLIVSTGGAAIKDIRRATDEIHEWTDNLALLQCTAAYPPVPEEINLRVISTLRDLYTTTVVGLSSHDPDGVVASGAYALGARILEVHFTLDRNQRGSDHAISILPTELRTLKNDLEKLRLSLGDGKKRVFESEKPGVAKMSKKIVARRDLHQGDRIYSDDMALRSPGNGLSPRYYDLLVGKTLKRNLTADENILLTDVEEGKSLVDNVF